MRFPLTMLAVGIGGASCLIAQTPIEFQQDFDVAIKRIAATYAYFDAKATRWNDVPALYAADLYSVKSRDEFIALLERVVDEMYDPHMQLTANLECSARLVPSGTDLWAEWQEGRATITQVRGNSDAERAGLKQGTLVIAIDDVPIAKAVEARLGRSSAHSVAAARDWALRAVLAGRHNTRRLLQIQERGVTRTVELPLADQFASRAPLDASEIRPGIGYIRLNDSLGNGAVVAAFDRALDELRNTRGLINDLRNTPSGGNSSVARGILGRFARQEQPYQNTCCPLKNATLGVVAVGSSWSHHAATSSTRGPLPCSSAAGLAAWEKAWRSGSMRQGRVRLSAPVCPASWERRCR